VGHKFKFRVFSQFFLALISASMIAPTTVRAEDFVVAIPDNGLADYKKRVISLIISKAQGNHTVKVQTLRVPVRRRAAVLASGAADFNVMVVGFSPEKDRLLNSIAFPLTKGVLGMRALVIRKESQSKFESIRNVEELKQRAVFGSGIGWLDTEILERNGFNVIRGSFRQLWAMLRRGRFEAFPRGAPEAMYEIDTYGTATVPFVVDANFIFAYRFDTLLHLKKEDKVRAAIIEDGLRKSLADGSFDKLFYSHPAIVAGLELIEKNQQNIVKFDNPTLSKALADLPDDYWYVPVPATGN
jgi:hypothetical protein